MNWTVKLDDLPQGALLLVDSSPLIYVLERHPQFSPKFKPLFDAHATGRFRFAASAITLVEVMIAPLRNGNEQLARQYRSLILSWQFVPLSADIAESAARLRASFRFALADAIQAASALSINAAAIVTHDRDFSRLKSLRVMP